MTLNLVNKKILLPLSIAMLTVFAGTVKAQAEEPDTTDATSALSNQVTRADSNASYLEGTTLQTSAKVAAPIPGHSVTKASALLSQAPEAILLAQSSGGSSGSPTTPGTRNPSTVPDTVPRIDPGATSPGTTDPNAVPSVPATTPGTRNPSTVPDTVPGGITPNRTSPTIISPGGTQPSTTTPQFQSPTTPDSTTPDSTTPGTTTPDSTTPGTTPGTTTPDSTTPVTPQFTPGTTPDTTTPNNNLIPPITPGRATRSGSSYVGIGANVGVGDGDTALGETSFELFSKIGLTRSFSARPSVQFSDDVTILLPITYDFNFGAGPAGPVGGALGVPIAPFVGIGAAVSTGDGGDVALLLTGGVDVPISPQFTATAAVNASVTGQAAVGIRVGVGYNFGGF
ncbi:MAG: hypothetical protein KME13_20750 [Myxacorys californica WJT36-NPBG1]|jgi:hypothetical protein|nr:hypothetical protein [Myxacorys californica WJT36-NPBG1]